MNLGVKIIPSHKDQVEQMRKDGNTKLNEIVSIYSARKSELDWMKNRDEQA